jgi:hypothetical protein
LLAEFDPTRLSKDALKTYAHSNYDAKVLFVPWVLSTISEKLAVDLFAVCFVLGLRDRKKYSYTRGLLNAYKDAGWLKKHTVKGQMITRRTDIEGVIRPPPTIQKKTRPLHRCDIAGLGLRNDISAWEIQVPVQWGHFLKSTRQLFSFPKDLDDSSSNLVSLAISAIALQKVPQLKSRVDEDVNIIHDGVESLKEAYFFLRLKLDEKRWKVSNREAAEHLAAFGLFSYADWSGKPR